MRGAGRGAREAARKAQAEIDNPAATLANFWEKVYLPAADGRKSAQTMKIENWMFKAWIAPCLGQMPLEDIKPAQVEQLMDRLREAGKSPRTQEHVKAILSGILSEAINRERLAGPNPCRRVRLVKEDNKRTRFLSTEDASTLLAALKKHSLQVHDEALLALFCGLRAKELFSLTWADVDFENRLIFVKDSKNKKLNRHAYMTGEVEAMLKRRAGNSAALVFPKHDGGRQVSVSPTFREVVNGLGWNDNISDRRLKLVFHSLRHTFASWLVMEGTPLFTVSKLLGHSDIGMTMRYAHLAPDHLRLAAGCLEGKLGGGG
jgi:integrase